MKKSVRVRAGLTLLCAALLPIIAGCSTSQQTSLTPMEQANFKGGPMTPEAQKVFAERMNKAKQQTPPPAGNRQ